MWSKIILLFIFLQTSTLSLQISNLYNKPFKKNDHKLK